MLGQVGPSGSGGGGGTDVTYALEIATGDIDGENKAFGYSAAPAMVLYNGQAQHLTTDFTQNGNEITFVAGHVAPHDDDIVSGFVPQ